MNIEQKILQEQMKQVQDSIYEDAFYADRYESVLKVLNLNQEGVRACQYTDKQTAELAHYFWTILPDSPEIHCRTFYKLCDVAENIFSDFDEKGKIIP